MTDPTKTDRQQILGRETAPETPPLDAFQSLVVVAREAVNGWACWARRDIELTEIARLHAEIARLATGRVGTPPAETKKEETEDERVDSQ